MVEQGNGFFDWLYSKLGVQDAQGGQPPWFRFAKKFAKTTVLVVIAGLGTVHFQQTRWAAPVAGFLIALDRYAQNNGWY